MWNSITQTFKNYFRFCGKADRREFWIWAFMILVVSFVLVSILAVLAAIFGNSNNPVTSGIFSTIIIVLIGLFWPVMFFPTLTVSVRRLRDAGVTPWLLLPQAVPWRGASGTPRREDDEQRGHVSHHHRGCERRPEGDALPRHDGEHLGGDGARGGCAGGIIGGAPVPPERGRLQRRA